MKTFLKFLLGLALVVSAQAQTAVATHAADYGSINAQPVTPGDVVGPASSTNNAFARWSGTTGKLLQDTADLTYSTPTLTTPDAFNISSAGSIALTGGGTSKSINLLPSTTGGVGVGVAGSTSARLRVFGTSVVTVPDDSVWISPQVPTVAFYSEGNVTGSGDMEFLAAGGTSASLNILMRKSGGTLASPAAVSTNNPMGQILSSAYDGGAFRNTAGIAFTMDGAVSSGVAPQRISFSTGDATSRNERVNLAANGRLNLGVTAESEASWLTTGIIFNTQATTYTNSSTATSGTAATAVFSSFLAPTLAATNATVTTTDAFNVYMVAPIQGTNQTITRKHTLGVVDSTSAASSITGGVVVSAALGTTATSTGIGGGNINTGGTITAGSSVTATFNVDSVQSISGAGAVDVTNGITEYTSTGALQALTLANGTAGQVKYIVHGVDGGSGILTPTTKTGYTTITFTNAGDSVTLVYLATRGWVIVGIFGAVAA